MEQGFRTALQLKIETVDSWDIYGICVVTMHEDEINIDENDDL